MRLLWIDYLIVACYLLGMIVVGRLLGRRVHTARGYFLAGRAMPFWAVGMSLVACDIGTTDLVGLTGDAYRHGLSIANFDWIGSFPAMIVAALIFIPFYWRAGVYTVPEFLGRRYSPAVRTLLAAVWVALLAFQIGGVFGAVGTVVRDIVGGGEGTFWAGIFAAALVIGAYATTGGLSAIVLTDVVQLVIMYTGCLAILIVGLSEVGGISGLRERIAAIPGTAQQFELIVPAGPHTPVPWPGVLFGLALVMAPSYYIGSQNIVQPALTAKDEWSAKAAILVGAVLKALVPVLLVTPGLIALALYGRGIADKDETFPTLVKNLLPPGMAGLMLAAFFAATISNIDSMMNGAATLFTKDIFQRHLRPAATDAELLLAGRVVSAVTLLAGVATAKLSVGGLYEYVQTLYSYVQGPTFAILVLGIFWRRCTAAAGLWGFIAGVAVAVFLHLGHRSAALGPIFTIEEPFLYVSFWSFAFSLLACAAITPFTRPHDDERLRGLVYGLVLAEPEAPRA
ncbi:MAG TPA: sodium/solute symporter [Planctomycetota bacterium]|nr:sodium/solute symporter [Planctomycetota bacterium]